MLYLVKWFIKLTTLVKQNIKILLAYERKSYVNGY